MVMTILDKVFGVVLGSSWRTSLLSLSAGFLSYFALVGTKLPANAQEWKEAAFAAILYAWGRVQKDQNVSNAPRPAEAQVVNP